ncbi:putative lipid II flippase FtsW [Oceanobacillus halophilus]|uniref:Probable peptidoglycan glycosyltransferase FtsW n=1 Tax=Oceanobacillus halophilus TaxID=930130 RepID=A0A494ZSC6_9BACI|nr:putative lipid II flippase FtsW [Oceanobacillus halophilus]RKQ28550.1 putative lipid II flippase FtsW [Oceanobacillus halophilus]
MKSLIAKKIKQFDYTLLFVIVFLAVFGIMMVYSSSYTIAYVDYGIPNYFYRRQLQWLFIGLFFFVLAAFFPYRVYSKLSPLLVMASILLLILVLIPGIGSERNYSQRWIELGPLAFQPTEVIKLFMIIYFASFYAKRQQTISHFKDGVLPPMLILAIIFLLILKQPDLGSAASILFVCAIIVICSGVKMKHLFMLGCVGLVGLLFFAYSSPYRVERITSFVDPFADPFGDGYQLINGYIAIGTGGMWGTGLGNGVQKLGFLPEAHTDFIMAIIIEELGMIGLIIVICSYMFIMFRGVRIARGCKDMFAKLLAIGITFQIMTQVVINLGAVSGLLPITGITLPLISYGGSSLVITMVSLGILLNLSTRDTGTG